MAMACCGGVAGTGESEYFDEAAAWDRVLVAEAATKEAKAAQQEAEVHALKQDLLLAQEKQRAAQAEADEAEAEARKAAHGAAECMQEQQQIGNYRSTLFALNYELKKEQQAVLDGIRLRAKVTLKLQEQANRATLQVSSLTSDRASLEASLTQIADDRAAIISRTESLYEELRIEQAKRDEAAKIFAEAEAEATRLAAAMAAERQREAAAMAAERQREAEAAEALAMIEAGNKAAEEEELALLRKRITEQNGAVSEANGAAKMVMKSVRTLRKRKEEHDARARDNEANAKASTIAATRNLNLVKRYEQEHSKISERIMLLEEQRRELFREAEKDSWHFAAAGVVLAFVLLLSILLSSKEQKKGSGELLPSSLLAALVLLNIIFAAVGFFLWPAFPQDDQPGAVRRVHITATVTLVAGMAAATLFMTTFVFVA